MGKKRVVIVTEGDRTNPKFDYYKLARHLRDELLAKDKEVHFAQNTENAITRLKEKREGGTLVFLSTIYCDTALRLAKELRENRIVVVVYSVARHPRDLPYFLFSGTHIPEIMEEVF